jgi:hypothetical protein
MGRHGAAPWAGHGTARLGSPMALGHAVPPGAARSTPWQGAMSRTWLGSAPYSR